MRPPKQEWPAASPWSARQPMAPPNQENRGQPSSLPPRHRPLGGRWGRRTRSGLPLCPGPLGGRWGRRVGSGLLLALVGSVAVGVAGSACCGRMSAAVRGARSCPARPRRGSAVGVSEVGAFGGCVVDLLLRLVRLVGGFKRFAWVVQPGARVWLRDTGRRARWLLSDCWPEPANRCLGSHRVCNLRVTLGHCRWLPRVGPPPVWRTCFTEVALSGAPSLSSPGPLSRSGHELDRTATKRFGSVQLGSPARCPRRQLGPNEPGACRVRTPRRRKGRPCLDTAPQAATPHGSAQCSMLRWLNATAPRGSVPRSTG
jgi:hypothetical protein